MSALAEPTVTPGAPAPEPAPKAPLPNGGLPDSVRPNKDYSADTFFKKHQEEQKIAAAGPAAPAAPAVVAPVAAPAAAPAAEPAPEKKPADLGGQLADSFLPEGAKPVAAPVAAPASENPEDKVELAAKYSPEAHESFKQVKTITKELRGTLVQRDAKIAELQAENERIRSGAAPVETPELVKLRAEHKAMSDRLVVLDLENHPNYQREFVAPRTAAEQEARNILEAAGVKDVDIAGLLGKDPVEFRRGLSAIAAKLPVPLDQHDFAAQMRTAYDLKQRAGQASAKAGELNQALKAQTQAGYKTAFESTFAETLGSAKIPELSAPADATPEQRAQVESFNSDFRAVRANAERIALGNTDPKSISKHSIQAAMYEFQVKQVLPMLSKSNAEKTARIAELEGQLKAINARNPGKTVGGIPHTSGGVDPSKMSHKEAAEYFSTLK